jgi:hypothetical protein
MPAQGNLVSTTTHSQRPAQPAKAWRKEGDGEVFCYYECSMSLKKYQCLYHYICIPTHYPMLFRNPVHYISHSKSQWNILCFSWTQPFELVHTLQASQTFQSHIWQQILSWILVWSQLLFNKRAYYYLVFTNVPIHKG